MTNKEKLEKITKDLNARLEALEQEERDRKIAQRFKEDEDKMNSVQWTNWDFKG